MGDLVELKQYKDDKEHQILHDLSPHVNIIDDTGKNIVTIYHPLSPMAFKQRQDQFNEMIDFRKRIELCAVFYDDSKPTLWQRVKGFLRGGL